MALEEAIVLSPTAQPEAVTLHVLGRALVMWGDITASEEWLAGMLPPLLQVGGFFNGFLDLHCSCVQVAHLPLF